MSSAERNTWVGLITSLIVNAYFYTRIWQIFADGTATAPDGLQIWARTVIWVIPASIGLTIVITILVSIAHGMITGEPSPTLKDERDVKFELWGMGATMALAVLGFLAALSGLALGYSGVVAFTLIYLGFSIGDLAGNLVKLGLYRCGV